MTEDMKAFLRIFFHQLAFANLRPPQTPVFEELAHGKTMMRLGERWSAECVEIVFPPNWESPQLRPYTTTREEAV